MTGGEEPPIENEGVIMLSGKFISPSDESFAERADEIRRHVYYGQDTMAFVRKIITNWEKRNGFKTFVTMDPARLGMALTTLHQKIHHGRAYGLKNMALDDPMYQHFRNIKLNRMPTYIKLTYITEGYIVKELEDAMEFGPEAPVDLQQRFLDWTASDPPNCATFPEDLEVQLTDDDVKFFRDAADTINKVRPVRFIIQVVGRKISVMSVKNTEEDV